jgi:acid phosphatase type 7
MTPMHRRSFLSSSLGGLTAALTYSPALFGQESPETAAPAPLLENERFAPASLFLTWRKDPTTTMTVQWVGPETTQVTTIYYVPRSGDVWLAAKTFTRPFPNTDLKVHRCELTGLKPGFEYLFQIGKTSHVYRFRTMPSRASDTFQFVSGGDSGIGLHAIGTNIMAARQEPYFALIAGDLAYDNGKSPKTFLTFLENYSRHMVDAKGRLIPMLSCIGNHEVSGGYKAKRADAPQYLSVFDGFFAETTYGVIDIGDYLSLVLLDTGHIAPIDGEQADWLAATLAERQECPHLIVANHVPAYPSVRNPQGPDGKFGTGEANRLHWSPLFERYNVDVVLEHHDHAFKRTKPMLDGLAQANGVVYLGDGSWGRLRTPHKPAELPYLASSSRDYHLSLHRIQGEERFHLALDEHGRVMDVCRTGQRKTGAVSLRG